MPAGRPGSPSDLGGQTGALPTSALKVHVVDGQWESVRPAGSLASLLLMSRWCRSPAQRSAGDARTIAPPGYRHKGRTRRRPPRSPWSVLARCFLQIPVHPLDVERPPVSIAAPAPVGVHRDGLLGLFERASGLDLLQHLGPQGLDVLAMGRDVRP